MSLEPEYHTDHHACLHARLVQQGKIRDDPSQAASVQTLRLLQQMLLDHIASTGTDVGCKTNQRPLCCTVALTLLHATCWRHTAITTLDRKRPWKLCRWTFRGRAGQFQATNAGELRAIMPSTSDRISASPPALCTNQLMRRPHTFHHAHQHHHRLAAAGAGCVPVGPRWLWQDHADGPVLQHPARGSAAAARSARGCNCTAAAAIHLST